MTGRQQTLPPLNDHDLSRLMFEARESLSMLADIVDSQTGRADRYTRSLVERIDSYRESRGWNPDGFGGECDV